MRTHDQVIENFIAKGEPGKGTYVKATDDLLHSRVPAAYRPFGQEPWGDTAAGQEAPLAVRLGDGSLLANGARLLQPMDSHQLSVLRALESTHSRFGVVPFHSIAAALTDGEYDDWDRARIPIPELKAETSIVVPSGGERWRSVSYKDGNGREHTRTIHTLGDSVVRVRDRYYFSVLDETGVGNGMFCLVELSTDRAPASREEALEYPMPSPRLATPSNHQRTLLRRRIDDRLPKRVRFGPSQPCGLRPIRARPPGYSPPVSALTHLCKLGGS